MIPCLTFKQLILFLSSWLVVALGQPSWVPCLGPIAAIVGFSCFWKTLQGFSKRSTRFYVASFWYILVQIIQLSWMTSIEYQGIYILFIYIFLAVCLGLQFGVISFCIPIEGNLTILRMLAIASLWTLIEWGRFYILCGFSLNPVGLALTCYIPPMQLAAIWGVLGLSFWVMLVNLCSLKFINETFPLKKINELSKKRTLIKPLFFLVTLSCLPYFFGTLHIFYHHRQLCNQESKKESAVVLLQTGLLPSQKVIIGGRTAEFISPWNQWKRILRFLKEQNKKTFDMIVLPEAAVPFLSDSAIYAFDGAIEILSSELGQQVKKYFPPLQTPFAEEKVHGDQKKWMVSNAFWMQTIANYFHSEVISGMDSRDSVTNKNFSAAFHFQPYRQSADRYEKRILVPLAEYLPFKWCLPFVEKYGISEFFTPGTQAKVFSGRIPLSISICYEETFPELISEGRKKGAEILVNVTNDNWYPFSRLPKQHFTLGRLRAIENGVPILRACNSGVTAAVNSFGQMIASMPEVDEKHQCVAGALSVSVPHYHYHTLFSHWGNGGIISISFIFLLIFLRLKERFSW